MATDEVYHGQTVKIMAAFRKFDSIAAAFDAHAALIATKPVYAPAMALLPKLDPFVIKLAQSYATDPLYAKKLLALIKGDNLAQYDI